MAQYPDALLSDIRAAVDIVDYVGRFVNLRKAGVNWKGLCPFHVEKTPSFMVNPRKGIFHCFGCGVGGDVFNFMMRQDRVTFPEAVRALAATAGIPLPEDRARGAGDSGREELLRAMDLAARFYAEKLWAPAGEHGRAYLTQRGIDPDVARRFGLGYAPDGWSHLLDFMKGERVPEETLVASGLAVPRDNRPGVYDRFRGRLLFAIRDLQARVVAFGGRAFGDEQPKYLNSPETPLYTKGNLLYAADLARDTIRDRNRALIVEGYVDCLMAHQHGFTETVAALGTAFTAAQLGVLRRYCDEVVTFFDADAAGQKAAERAEELLEPTDAAPQWAVSRTGGFDAPGALRVKVALLPAGHDPDTFLRAEGAEGFAERIASARSLLAYALDRVVGDASGAAGSRAQHAAFTRAAHLLAKVPDAQEAAALSNEAARRLGVDPTQLWTEARRLGSALHPPRPVVGEGAATAAMSPEERGLVLLMLESAAARAALLGLVDEGDVAHPQLRAIVAALKRRPEAVGEALLVDFDDPATRSVLAALLVEERAGDDAAAEIRQYQQRLERARRLQRMRALSRSLAEAEGTAAAPPHDAFRTLTDEGRWMLSATRGAAGTHTTGPESPQGVQRND
ncbi:MAG TPA: DNA primase [Solirubrobacterales bacterium]|nr:DNA primase [Solirubrobacterales bacterium]